MLCLCHRDEAAVCEAAICTDYIIKGDATSGKRPGYTWGTARRAQINIKEKRNENTDLRNSCPLFVCCLRSDGLFP